MGKSLHTWKDSYTEVIFIFKIETFLDCSPNENVLQYEFHFPPLQELEEHRFNHGIEENDETKRKKVVSLMSISLFSFLLCFCLSNNLECFSFCVWWQNIVSYKKILIQRMVSGLVSNGEEFERTLAYFAFYHFSVSFIDDRSLGTQTKSFQHPIFSLKCA